MVLFFLSKVQKVLLFLLSLNFVNFSCCWFISEESTIVLLSFDTEGFNLVTLHQLNLPFKVISFEKKKVLGMNYHYLTVTKFRLGKVFSILC